MTFTEEQLEILKQATPHFESAKRGYVKNAPRHLTEQIINVYESTGKTLTSKDLSCAICVLRIYQRVGALYFKDIEELKQIEENKPGEEQETSTPKSKSKKKSK